MSDTIGASLTAHGRTLRLALLLIAFLLIIANGAVALISVAQLYAADARTARALRAIVLLKEVEDLAEGSSREQRAWRVYGDVRELEAFRQARAELPARLQRLRAAAEAAPDSSLPDGVERLSTLIEQDTAALMATLTPIEGSADHSRPPELTASVDRADTIVDTIDELIAEQATVLDQRVRVIAARNTIVFATAVLAAIASMALIGVIFAMMRRDLHRTEQLAERHFGARRESEQRFQRIFEESPLGVLLAEPDTRRIVQANPAFCRMLGFEPAQVAGRTIAELMHVDDREMLDRAIRDGGGADVEVEARHVTRSGAISWARVHLTQLSALDGRPGLLLALTEDVTREKRVEAELRQAQKMEAIGQLTGGIAHDFNNLLGVIIGNVEFLIDTARDTDQAKLAHEILDSAISGADLTRRPLAFARRQPLQPRRIDLNAYLPNHIAILRRLLGETITVSTLLADDLWPTRADPSQVGDALLNLAINARDAMPHGGTIWISTGNLHLAEGDPEGEVKAGDYVVLGVTDSGIGMSPEVLERAVEPFFSTKAPRAGSGLGLSMIFGFAKQSGGHLRIDSRLGLGTTVRLYLPRARGVDQYGSDAVERAPLPQGSESILLVDDNPEMRRVARRHLVALGYRVCEADSGPAALESLTAGDGVDLMLTDVVMPGGMNGYQLADAARQLRPALKVLFTTGYAHPEPGDKATGAAGATIHKPYRRQELAATVRAALEA
jgi:PAS domain S-box-containing protein